VANCLAIFLTRLGVIMNTDVRIPEGDVDEFWDEFYWEDLSSEEQNLWSVLGWTKAEWDDDEGEVPSDDKDWEELSDNEQSALIVLGYDEEYWDS
jgi:hypothetical protein